MRVPLWLAVALGVVGVCLLIIAYFGVPWIRYQPFLASAGAILAGLGAGAEILGLLSQWYKERKEGNEKRKQKLREHTKILNKQVYKKLLHILIRPDSRGKRTQCMV